VVPRQWHHLPAPTTTILVLARSEVGSPCARTAFISPASATPAVPYQTAQGGPHHSTRVGRGTLALPNSKKNSALLVTAEPAPRFKHRNTVQYSKVQRLQCTLLLTVQYLDIVVEGPVGVAVALEESLKAHLSWKSSNWGSRGRKEKESPVFITVSL